MAYCTTKINVRIIGIGKSKIGLNILKFVARIFHIKLEVKTEVE